MKTTIELPDLLLQRVKLLAVQRGENLKNVVADLLEFALRAERRRDVRLPTPLKLKGRGPLTTEEIEEAINEGRE